MTDGNNDRSHVPAPGLLMNEANHSVNAVMGRR
jgi:hypothetical protein